MNARDLRQRLLEASALLPALAAAASAAGYELGLVEHLASFIPSGFAWPLSLLPLAGFAVLCVACSIWYVLERCRQCDWHGRKKTAAVVLFTPVLLIAQTGIALLAAGIGSALARLVQAELLH